jgi:hypothetical protein
LRDDGQGAEQQNGNDTFPAGVHAGIT